MRLACDLSDKISAIAYVGSPLPPANSFTCEPKRAIPVLNLHGTKDQCVGYDGGKCGGCFESFLRQCLFANPPPSQSMTCASVDANMEHWAKVNGCKMTRKAARREANMECFEYDGCKTPVTHCRFNGLGHQWPGSLPEKFCQGKSPALCKCYRTHVSGFEESPVNANELIWQFFEAAKP
jgi:polyhydroxybutyrate depolymerase